MEDIIIETGYEPTSVNRTRSGLFVRIDSDEDTIMVSPESVDKLIEALQKVKEEFNHE